jgi:flagellar hook-length control protein FliK
MEVPSLVQRDHPGAAAGGLRGIAALLLPLIEGDGGARPALDDAGAAEAFAAALVAVGAGGLAAGPEEDGSAAAELLQGTEVTIADIARVEPEPGSDPDGALEILQAHVGDAAVTAVALAAALAGVQTELPSAEQPAVSATPEVETAAVASVEDLASASAPVIPLAPAAVETQATVRAVAAAATSAGEDPSAMPGGGAPEQDLAVADAPAPEPEQAGTPDTARHPPAPVVTAPRQPSSPRVQTDETPAPAEGAGIAPSTADEATPGPTARAPIARAERQAASADVAPALAARGRTGAADGSARPARERAAHVRIDGDINAAAGPDEDQAAPGARALPVEDVELWSERPRPAPASLPATGRSASVAEEPALPSPAAASPAVARTVPAPAPAPRSEAWPATTPLAERVVDALHLSAARDGAEIRVRCEPDGLGHLDVRIQVRNDGVHAVVMAEYESTRSLLHSQQHVLEQALARSELRLSSFSVDLGLGQQAGRFGHQGGGEAGMPGQPTFQDATVRRDGDGDAAVRPSATEPGRLSLRV